MEEENDGEEEDEQSGKEEEGLALRCAVCRQNYPLSLAYFQVFDFQKPVFRICIGFSADPNPEPAY